MCSISGSAIIMLKKLYISAVIVFATIASLFSIANSALAVHDSLHYSRLPLEYRSGIQRLQAGWHFSGLSDKQQDAISRVHQRWYEAGHLSWLDAGIPVDMVIRKHEALANFEKFVPRWGFRLHQQYPIATSFLALLSFVPMLVLMGLRRWVRWLTSPSEGLG